jgi:heme exporter protein D
MINELISMSGYGAYVWSAFSFTMAGFTSLFLVIKLEQTKEKRKFASKFISLNFEKTRLAESHIVNQEILSITVKV